MMLYAKMRSGLSMSSYTLNKALSLLLFPLFAFALLGCDNRAHISPEVPQIPISDIRSCDLVFRLGRSIESAIVAADGGYSHIGVIIRANSGLWVAHIEPSREGQEQTKYESLEEFFRSDRALAGCVMRLEELDPMQRERVENYLLSCRNISFDHDYMLSDTTQMYCTELVWRAFLSVEVDLSAGTRRKLPLAREQVILPTDIFANEALVKVWSY